MIESNGCTRELRCFCTRRPLLGVIGQDAVGTYLHIKVYKQGRIYGEVVAYAGPVKILCRECLRWHVVKIEKMRVDFQQIPG